MNMNLWPFSEPNQISTWICTVIILKPAFKTKFSVHNKYLNLCMHVKNSRWLLWIRKTDIKDF